MRFAGLLAYFSRNICGLRIGFEKARVVQEKREEAYIRCVKDHLDLCNK